jgi:hypothetical protein
MGKFAFHSGIAVCIIACAVILTPIRILSLGYFPLDDAKRHAAKVISGKSWQDILVLRDDIKMDSHPGWNLFLQSIHKLSRWNAKELVVFSVVFLFVFVVMLPLLLVRKPESWVFAVVAAVVIYSSMATRLLSGRPFLIGVFFVVYSCFRWREISEKKMKYTIPVALIVLSAAGTWIQSTWYLMLLPVLSFACARQWRGAFRLAATTLGGVAIGACLTGKPLLYLTSTNSHAYRAFSLIPHDALVFEFLPLMEWWQPLVAAIVVLIARQALRKEKKTLLRNPVLFLAGIGYGLAFFSARFWSDWGLPAFTVWMAMELEALKMPEFMNGWRPRMVWSLLVAILFYQCFVNHPARNWKKCRIVWNISPIMANAPEWLPEKGGILYNYDMQFFYDTFFLFPHAPWRYMLGFEPTMMPDNDLQTYAAIMSPDCSYESFGPWVRKMTVADRLFLTHHSPSYQPEIPGLQWRCFGPGLWIGRLPPNGASVE